MFRLRRTVLDAAVDVLAKSFQELALGPGSGFERDAPLLSSRALRSPAGLFSLACLA